MNTKKKKKKKRMKKIPIIREVYIPKEKTYALLGGNVHKEMKQGGKKRARVTPQKGTAINTPEWLHHEA